MKHISCLTNQRPAAAVQSMEMLKALPMMLLMTKKGTKSGS